MNIRNSTVVISKEDKEKLQKNCEEIEKILDKYPYSNDCSDHFVTSMTRVKNYFSDFKEWVNFLEVTEK